MTSKKELQLAYGIAIVLFVVGVISYTAFSAKPPEQPIRIVFKGAAGKVMFTHKTHADQSGYGIACKDCHHHPKEGQGDNRACTACHAKDDNVAFQQKNCLECHGENEVSAQDVKKKTDAFHEQCIGCHKQQGSGPEKCAACHVM